MIPVAYTFIARAGLWQGAPYPNIEEARKDAQGAIIKGASCVDILLLIRGSEYLVEQLFDDPCHKIIYHAITKSCEGVGEDTFEGPNFGGALVWAERKVKMSRIIEVQIYLRVAGQDHLIDIIVPE
jgi:hypothetical protein